MNDQGPDFLAELDQMARAAKDVAQVMHAYYVACIEAGFSADAALALTVAYQNHMFRQPNE